MRSLLGAQLLLVLLALPAAASDLSVSAQVNRTELTLNEQVMLTVSVSGSRTSLPEPRMPSVPKFNVHSAGRSQNISFVNGKVTSSVQHRYVLVPRFVGKAVIPPISVSAGGETKRTEPVEITVLRPSASPRPQARTPARRGRAPSGRRAQRASAGPDLFVTAEADKKDPYVNEQVMMTVRFHYAVPLLGNAEWEPPAAPGFIKEDLPPKPASVVSRNGRNYYITEIKIVLFPIHPGRLEIGPTKIRCQVQREMAVDPFANSFFDQFFSQGMMGAVTRELRTKPIRITARPLPEEGKPQGFSGAVGRFDIRSSVDKKKVKVGDAVTLSVSVEGTGNLKSIGDLPLPEMDSFRVYETVSELSTSKDERGVRGTKTFKTVLVPKASGRLEIPPVQFNYFDPERKEYITIQTHSHEIEVSPGKAPEAPIGFKAGVGTTGGGEITRIKADIRYLKTSLEEPFLQRAAFAIAGLGWLHLIPVWLFLLSLGWTAYQNKLSSDPAWARSSRALSAAARKVRESRRADAPEKAAGILFETLTGYVADKLNCPASGLTLREAARRLQEKRLPDGHLHQLRTLWQELESFRFAPKEMQDSNMATLADGVKSLVEAMEEDLP